MKERPILLGGDEVRATLDGRKTVLRRVVKIPAEAHPGVEFERMQEYPDGLFRAVFDDGAGIPFSVRPLCQPGDRLWVRETWAVGACADGLSPSELHQPIWTQDNGGIWLAADGSKPTSPISPRGKWRPSIFMPRWTSRITLDVVSVRVERLQDITEENAIAEGIERGDDFFGCPTWRNYLPDDEDEASWFPDDPIGSFRSLWDSINTSRGYSWESNPWVWRIEFRRAPCAP